ncbi:MAG TPA: murein biosynthesis integral membrane protein MurJ, partial [Firmicutes bacterium]|nr:murein biosynthesis integral membrane protein MurJ [Bacillota bacterium]
VPVLGPVLYNIGIILGAYFLGPHFGIKGMATGVVVGAMANFFLQAAFVLHSTKGYNPFYLNLKHPGFKRMLVLMVPALVGLSATQLNIWVSTTMASGLAEGSITALRFGQRLVLLPIGIFAMAISTAFFPTLSRLSAQERWEQFKTDFSTGIRVIIFIMIPSAVGFIILRYEIINLLFQGGEFTAAHTELTAYALLFYSLGLFAHGVIQLLPRGFYALKDTVTPVKVTLATVALSIILNLLFLNYTNLGHGGLALSFSLMGIANMLLSSYFLRRKLGGIKESAILHTLLLSLVAAVGMGIVLMYALNPWNAFLMTIGLKGKVFIAFQVGGGIGIGIITYLALAYVLNMEELKLLRRIVGRRC